MSFEDFQLTGLSTIDTSFITRDVTKIYQQQGARLNYLIQNIETIFGENNYYHQIGISCPQYDITTKNIALPAPDGDPSKPPTPDFFKADAF